MDIFEEIQLSRLKNDLIAHLDKYFSKEIQQFERKQLSQFVVHVIKEAQFYGIEIEKQICIFLNIKIVLKIYKPFDQESHSRILDILNNRELGNPGSQLDKLSEKVDLYLEKIAENSL